MSGIGDVFKSGGQAEQLLIWGVLQQLLQPLLAPLTTELGKLMYSATPDVPLSPEAAAAAVARGLIDSGSGQDKANDSGIGQSDFHIMAKLAGNGPDLGTLVAAFQRGLIHTGSNDPTQLSLFGGLTDTGLRDEWHDVVAKLAVQIPTGAEVMNAWLEGQITEGEARDRWLKAGGDPTWFQTAYDANGEAPTPIQLLELVNRKIIPWNGTGPRAVSYEQGFLEGPWRNKWEPAFRALAEHVTPPRSVTAMFHAGQLNRDQAARELAKSGLTPEMITAYLSPAHHAAVAVEHQLAKADIVALYSDKAMPRADAVKALTALKYSTHNAELLLDLADLKAAMAQLKEGTSRVRTLFQGGKITATDAATALHELGIPSASAREMISLWQIAMAHKVRELTPSQIEQAVHHDLITGTEGMARLMALGYDEADAWLALAVTLHGPVPGVPRPAALGPAPRPGGAA